MNVSSMVRAIQKESEDSVVSRMRKNGLKIGGKYEPSVCRPRHKIAIIVPYRKRHDHLAIFLRYMHPFLQRQQLHYTIFVVEQSGNIILFHKQTHLAISI